MAVIRVLGAVCVVSAGLAEATGVMKKEATGNHFLGSRAQHLSAAGLAHNGVKDLLKEIELVAGKDHREATEGRIGRLERALAPMFAAMPKDDQGRLDAAGVRYMLHRLFVQRHGWFVNGLDNDGEAWASSSPADVFKGHADSHHSLFHGKLDSGFSLHQVAVFAATLETLVHGESLERLEAAYRVLGLMKSENLSDDEAQEAIKAYMLMYVQSTNLTTVTSNVYKEMSSIAVEAYPTWPDTVEFVKGVRERILEDTSSDDRNTWQTSLKVVEEVAERYGRWQDKECHTLKNMLLQMEKPGTGRVRLQDFWGNAMTNGSWQFVESVPYLQQLGALDESNPDQLSVIIPNYLYSPANCVASSKFYSVCCIDECPSLLSHLEAKIAAPDASPEQIVNLVSGLSSGTVDAPRQLPDVLIQRLKDIAAHHGGRVPLHGRLFAQWMHHAYPRECPFPHLAGTTKPLTQEEWLEHSSEPIMAGEDDIRKLLEATQPAEKAPHQQAGELGLAAQELPWSHEEELFAKRPDLPKTSSGGAGGVFQWLCMVLSVPAGLVVLFMRNYAPATAKKAMVADKTNHKYFV